MENVMKNFLFAFVAVLMLSAPVAAPATAAELSNVGPKGDTFHSGDLNARRYSRMLERWKTEETTNTATLQQRYQNAPQTALLAQEDPSMPSMMPQQQGCNCQCPQMGASNAAPSVAMAPRQAVQQQSLQPLYNNQQAGSGMMPPVVITGGQY